MTAAVARFPAHSKARPQLARGPRLKAAREGKALPGGGYPIRNPRELMAARRLAGKSKRYSKAVIQAHIRRRARALGVKLSADQTAAIDLAIDAGLLTIDLTGHWRHNWVPLDAAAVMSKNHGHRSKGSKYEQAAVGKLGLGQHHDKATPDTAAVIRRAAILHVAGRHKAAQQHLEDAKRAGHPDAERLTRIQKKLRLHAAGYRAAAMSLSADGADWLDLAGKWRHGWIPLDAAALLSKRKGKHGGSLSHYHGGGGKTKGLEVVHDPSGHAPNMGYVVRSRATGETLYRGPEWAARGHFAKATGTRPVPFTALRGGGLPPKSEARSVGKGRAGASVTSAIQVGKGGRSKSDRPTPKRPPKRQVPEWEKNGPYQQRQRQHITARERITPSSADLTEAAAQFRRDNPGTPVAGHEKEISRLAHDRAARKFEATGTRSANTPAQSAAEKQRTRDAAAREAQFKSDTARRLAAEKSTPKRSLADIRQQAASHPDRSKRQEAVKEYASRLSDAQLRDKLARHPGNTYIKDELARRSSPPKVDKLATKRDTGGMTKIPAGSTLTSGIEHSPRTHAQSGVSDAVTKHFPIGTRVQRHSVTGRKLHQGEITGHLGGELVSMKQDNGKHVGIHRNLLTPVREPKPGAERKITVETGFVDRKGTNMDPARFQNYGDMKRKADTARAAEKRQALNRRAAAHTTPVVRRSTPTAPSTPSAPTSHISAQQAFRMSGPDLKAAAAKGDPVATAELRRRADKKAGKSVPARVTEPAGRPKAEAPTTAPAIARRRELTQRAASSTPPVVRRSKPPTHTATEVQSARMTYRKRRERRAERLRGWSEGRAAKATAAFEQSSRMADAIPFGQPVLVGHHSERRDRNYRARIVATGQRGLEHHRTAERHAEKAGNIESQLAGSIYSDDPDAIPALQSRIAKLEAERDRIKAYNASARKGAHDPSVLDDRQRRQLAIVHKHATDYDRRRKMQFPAYHLTNLNGNINRQKKRLEQLQRRAK